MNLRKSSKRKKKKDFVVLSGSHSPSIVLLVLRLVLFFLGLRSYDRLEDNATRCLMPCMSDAPFLRLID